MVHLKDTAFLKLDKSVQTNNIRTKQQQQQQQRKNIIKNPV